MRRSLTVLLFVLLAAILSTGSVRAGQSFVVAAASSLQHALDELSDAFAGTGHERPRLVFGSSGNIAEQIARGAPFELFLSADEAYVEALLGRGSIEDDGAVYALGRLAIFVAGGSPVVADDRLDGLRSALDNGNVTRLAIANPELAPYGRAAIEVLEALGISEKARDRLVYGENVAQAAQFAASGAADAGIIALSLAQSPGMSERGEWAAIDASLHGPLRQRMALTRKAGGEARAFFAFILGAEGRAILERHGFGLPSSPESG
ncbi:MAG: molybdate ABC transporter substrate-binding protein [Geminicoccaceae bacterium]